MRLILDIDIDIYDNWQEQLRQDEKYGGMGAIVCRFSLFPNSGAVAYYKH